MTYEARIETIQRLGEFLRACNYSGDLGTAREADAVSLVSTTLRFRGAEIPVDDRKLLKLAALTVSYFRQVAAVADGEVDLDFREEEVLKAVLDHRGREN